MPLADLAAEVFRDVPLEAKEGLSVLNANAFSTGWAALAIADARTLLDAMTLAAALDLEGFGANLTPLHEAVGKARPYPGLIDELDRMRGALAGSRLWQPGAARNLQDPLSFRGAAAILGAARDALGFVERQLAVELNASQENPLALLAEDRIISVANYESLPLATALDLMRIALVPAVSAANERLIKMLQAPQTGLSDGLHAPGVSAESSLSEYTWPAQALAIEARLLGQPVSLEIPSASQAEGLEDRASMTPLAARRLSELVELARGVVAIELVVAAQAVELRHGAVPRRHRRGRTRDLRRRARAGRVHRARARRSSPTSIPCATLIARGGLMPLPARDERRDLAGRARRRRRAADAAARGLRERGPDLPEREHPAAHPDPRRARAGARRDDRAEGHHRRAHRGDGARAARGRNAAHRPHRRRPRHAGPWHRHRADRSGSSRSTQREPTRSRSSPATRTRPTGASTSGSATARPTPRCSTSACVSCTSRSPPGLAGLAARDHPSG